MIDRVPSANPAMPVLPAIAAAPGQSTTDPAICGAARLPKTAPFPHQISFASTLQNRIKLTALNNTAAAKQEKLPGLAHLFADLINQTALMTANAVVPQDAKDSAVADSVSSQAEDDGSSTASATIAPAAPDSATVVPLALNATNPPVLTSLPQTTAAPKPTVAADNAGISLQESASAAINNNMGNAVELTTEKANEQTPAAVLAATPEKTAPAAANQDGKVKDATFADMLHISTPTPQAVANPTQVQAPSFNASLPVREVPSSVASAHWANDVGNQLNWMVSQRESRADLVLNPPQLGRIEVSITLNGDQASASFVSVNPEVRAALQDSLPRLREVLADVGVFLGQANIGAESFRQGGNGAEKGGKSLDDSFSPAAQSLLVSITGPLPIMSAQQANRGRGLIDLFA